MYLPKIDEVMDMWDKESPVDSTEPGKEILRIPTLHAKYVRILTNHSLAAKQCTFEYARMKKIKTEYYSGRMDDQDLKKFGWEPFRFILKSDMNVYIEGDDDLQRILAKKVLHDNVVEYCTMIVKELTSRTYQLRSYMDWEKFIVGQR
jgi:hypothetical protein